ncbi:sodium/calcium exchanger 1a isoform X1 [Gadus macrocephalus]|uniref:sodium/calcium exchanger 1a isoform X1 n=1 Tax=Gadus macrocephalus TaxID=80720 RepID=UPI0028CB32F4|nr:sodium/calcium exchanger 1a isoform X1 [Gadus macrocephalus]XP_059903832.1 sodium/calcium exchanger 1a isoform X1 [Gadus macrocephalus]
MGEVGTPSLFLSCTVFLLFVPASLAASSAMISVTNSSDTNSTKCGGNTDCLPGVILPVWLPLDPPLGEKLARAAIYFLGMMYMFLGVSIIADRFMASIEVITSQERQVTIKKANGEKVVTTVRVWNETVSNLTLMALGSSAPEILLSVVEVCGHDFNAGQLGPNTIVGSAAFNMFVIIGLCVSVIPDGEHRKVKHLRVFFVTAAWSIFAYTWLYLILAVISPGIVEVWEGLVTLCFFPVCVGFAYVADRRLLFYKYMHKRYRAGRHKGMIIETEGEPEHLSKADLEMDVQTAVPRVEELRGEANEGERSCAVYRCHGARAATGAPGNVLKKHDQAKRVVHHSDSSPTTSKIFFEPESYQCVESCRAVALRVVRRGGQLDHGVSVDYRTEDGTAKAGADYRFTEGTVSFRPGETEKEIPVGIVDDDVFEEEEHFLVHLSNVRVTGESCDPQGSGLGLPCSAAVTILDDDHAGVFTFQDAVVTVSESVGLLEVKVVRTGGARGVVALPYKTLEGTARGGGEDFEDTHGVLEFDDDQIVKTIQINIVDDEEYEKNKNLFLEIGEPRLLEMSGRKAVLLQEAGGFIKTDKRRYGGEVYRKVQGREGRDLQHSVVNITEGAGQEESVSKREEAERRVAALGRPRLGEHARLEVVIEESYEFKNLVDKLVKKTNLALVIGTNSWREQFRDAITVNPVEDDDNEEEQDGRGERRLPSCFDYVMHFLTVFWKLLFALVPPTDYCNGWACFVVSISGIGLLTAFIGDLASHFGCTVGLKDSVTAVVFVALGTSVPDTFASKLAAIQDQYADASIGNVTGSNAVNVFLGIGVAWSIAAVYHQARGDWFRVDPGTLAFSVTLFTVFALVCVAVLMFRRRASIGGELGGPRGPKVLTSCLFFSLWLVYIVLSSLEAYCHIQAF